LIGISRKGKKEEEEEKKKMKDEGGENNNKSGEKELSKKKKKKKKKKRRNYKLLLFIIGPRESRSRSKREGAKNGRERALGMCRPPLAKGHATQNPEARRHSRKRREEKDEHDQLPEKTKTQREEQKQN